MKPAAKVNLQEARRKLGQCAGIVGRRDRPTPEDRSLCVALGSGRDWVRWAVSMSDVTFADRRESESARKHGIVESVRFNQLWTATNALFAKDELLRLTTTGALRVDEAGRFATLYRFAAVDPALERNCVTTLHALLGTQCNAVGMGSVLGNLYPTMWEIIDQKYAGAKDRKRGIGKVISSALRRRVLPEPDAPTLIYGARNWAVHGMLLTSFFRGSKQQYITFIDNITLLLSATLRGTAENLRPLL